MKKVPISVIILAKNEENSITACIGSVAEWADEVIVADDGSTDRTRGISSSRGARVVSLPEGTEGGKRNWAYAQAAHEWVLSLDADEEASEALKAEISQVLSNRRISAFAIPIKTYIGDRWVRYSGWYPASKIRLFQKERFRYEESEVHPRAFVEGETGRLTADIIHHGYPDFEHFLASLNRQTTLEAQKWVRTGTTMTRGRIIRRVFDRFFRSFLRKRGYKDGFLGFMIAFFASAYQLISYAKYRQMKNKL